MAYKMTDERWESVMGYIRESVRHPEKTPDNVLLLALSKEELTQIFTRRRIELIEAIKEKKPKTMSELATSLKRALPAIERDLKALEKFGVVELEKTGREVRPVIEKEVIVLPLVKPISLKQMG
ncbi:MAG: ArsR family transcriptional regulator [Candidatus Aenigmarchaeota archaeon]|nr:ArsR family transcriptional regulator [Candidatus Aenigmarchaeota archaeon]